MLNRPSAGDENAVWRSFVQAAAGASLGFTSRLDCPPNGCVETRVKATVFRRGANQLSG